MAPTLTTIRWLWIWITILVLVVIVVIGFLFGIASALESIDTGLAEANRSVMGANGDVKPLPAHIEDINGNLGRVDTNLKPLSDQAHTIIRELGSVRSRLVDVNGSLTSTSGLLVGTEGSLRDTSGTLAHAEGRLVDIRGSLRDTSGSLIKTEGSLRDTSGTLDQAEGRLVRTDALVGRIRHRLFLAQDFRSIGTNGIWRRVRFLNGGALFEPGDIARFGFGVGHEPPDAERGATGLPLHKRNVHGLRDVQSDTSDILRGLFQVNQHLTSICQSPVVTTTAKVFQPPPPRC